MLYARYALAAGFSRGKDVAEVACGPGIGLGYLIRQFVAQQRKSSIEARLRKLIEDSRTEAKETLLYAKEKSAKVILPLGELSLAIGKEGQNVRLAAKLTGYKIDIAAEGEKSDASKKDPEKNTK